MKATRTPCAGRSKAGVDKVAPNNRSYIATAASIDGQAMPT